MTHRYAVGRDGPDGRFHFRDEVVEGQFAEGFREGQARPLIRTEAGPLWLDPANDIFDVCVNDYRIPVWEHGEVACGRLQRHYNLREGPDGPTVEPGFVKTQQYLLIEAELRNGRPHPGTDAPPR